MSQRACIERLGLATGMFVAVLLAMTPAVFGDDALGVCAVPDPGPAAAMPLSQAGPLLKVGTAVDCGFDSTNPSADYDPSVGLLTLDVVVHIIMDDTCTQGVVSDATVHTQMDILNEDFLAIAGSPGAGGTDTQIRFVLADEDPSGNPTTGITRDCDTTWYNDQGDYWDTLAWDPNRYINIYVNTAAGSGGYVPFLPSASNAAIGSSSDRVVINQLGFGPGGPVPARDQGRLATHEVGHYLGLFHPYQNGCGLSTVPDCYTTGDRLCDTEPDDTSHSGCPVGQTACGGFLIPATNYMELTDDSCKDMFTLEQARRMRCTLEFYRPGLSSDALCGDANCDPGENTCNCPGDCGFPDAIETACDDGADNDCDGDVDCADVDCVDEPVCSICTVDADCDNGIFCDGAETCDAILGCQAGSDPCPGEVCDEAGDVCVGAGPAIWMSFRSNTTIPGVGTVADEDIVSYDEDTDTWALEFDGSDVGLGGLEISGLAVLPSGDLLLSFTVAGTVGGISVDDSDIVQFTPTSLGATTSGAFSLYFDGSDVGLTSNSEDVDSIAFATDGRLIVSSTGGFSGAGASGADEDLFLFTGTLGAATSGSFVKHFDGSDVALNNSSAEDVDAAAFLATGELLFSTVGAFAVTGASGADEDVAEFAGTFGSTTSGTFVLRLDLDGLGIDPTEDIGSLHVAVQ